MKVYKKKRIAVTESSSADSFNLRNYWTDLDGLLYWRPTLHIFVILYSYQLWVV
jgi:hypothetical protein